MTEIILVIKLVAIGISGISAYDSSGRRRYEEITVGQLSATQKQKEQYGAISDCARARGNWCGWNLPVDLHPSPSRGRNADERQQTTA